MYSLESTECIQLQLTASLLSRWFGKLDVCVCISMEMQCRPKESASACSALLAWPETVQMAHHTYTCAHSQRNGECSSYIRCARDAKDSCRCWLMCNNESQLVRKWQNLQPTLSHYNPVAIWEYSTTIQPRLHGVAWRTVCAPVYSPDEAIIKIGCGAYFM